MTDLEGIGAELIYCKVNNLYPDLETDIYPLPEEDAITKQGLRVDVKSTKYPNGHLLAVLGKNNKKLEKIIKRLIYMF